jgi:hypothetical protein
MGVPAELDEVILRCLHVEPSERYTDTAELARALAPFGPAGSVRRAEVIARILGASRSRTHDSGASLEITGGVASHVRPRVSSSAHSLRTRRIRRGALLLAAFVLAGLTVGARALYASGEAAGIASAVTSPTAAGPPAPADPGSGLAAPAFARFAASESPAPPATPAAVDAAQAVSAAALPAPAAVQAVTAAALPPTTAAQAPPVAAAPTPPAYRVSTAWSDRAAAPSTDERSLFEDRK